MYESPTTQTTDALKAASPTIFNDTTINQILALTTKDNATTAFDTATPDANGNVTVAAGTEVVFVASSDTAQTTVIAPANAPVVIFQGQGGVNATFGTTGGTPGANTGTPDRIVVGSSGNDKIVISDSLNSKVILGTGNSTVQAGAGHDTIEAGLGNSTITGGEGNHTIVKLTGGSADYVVTVVDGHAVVSHVAPAAGPSQGATAAAGSVTTDLSHVQYVQLDNNEALIIANDTNEAAIASLYHTAFGRDADVAGLQFWFDLAKAGSSLKDIAVGFTNSAEFKAVEAQPEDQFVEALYHNTFGRAAEDGAVEFWVDQLAHGATRAQLITTFADIAAQNIAGSIETEAVVVGSVTVVHGIV